MPIEHGELVYINFTAKVKDAGEVIETTLEEEAKKLGIHDQTRKYEPKLVAVGEGWVLRGLDEEFEKMELGEKKSIELLPEKAWGERDPALVRMVPLRKFGDKASELRVDDVVEVDNKIGIVRFVGSGRAQIDFNHRLAGKTLIYEVEVIEKLETDEEKIKALMKRRFAGQSEKISFAKSEDEVTIEIPEELFLLDGLQIIKRSIANDVFHFIPSIKRAIFKESYMSKEKDVKKAQKDEGVKTRSHA
jgi:peptidylprolyl isomerase